MQEPERFRKAYDKLLEALKNGSLVNGNCTSCAVGHICGNTYEWKDVFVSFGFYQNTNPKEYKEDVKEIIDSTGYSWEQLAMIEYAFESINHMIERAYGDRKMSTLGVHIKIMTGLAASVKVMCDLDGLPFGKYIEEIALVKPNKNATKRN